jgi:acyl-coenzyme A thioesterase PaaI-like protein
MNESKSNKSYALPSGTGLQSFYAPKSICFGCGPANEKGLRIQSIPLSEEQAAFEGKPGLTVATWKPESYHEAFPGVLNGGIIGALLDCHSNWTAAYWLMKKKGMDHPPCTVTAGYSIELKRPTPTDAPIELKAWVTESTEDRAVVQAILLAREKITATCRGTFVQVKPGHPAYHRW